jgi:hypothetical protein
MAHARALRGLLYLDAIVVAARTLTVGIGVVHTHKTPAKYATLACPVFQKVFLFDF